uniref:Trafficking kinesin-binding protein C-terminal domain-containing protein n=1 Tax=Ditylenchus dipsaci TaxID=166011 RepID=A0A915DHI0_9BILA
MIGKSLLSNIGRLQEQIIEKNKECALQAEDTERLVKEIGQRKNREKALIDANDDLSTQLHTAVSSHETLKLEVSALQESYLMSWACCEKLKMNSGAIAKGLLCIGRTSSADSLYDSLASELEASDSGCYNTPMFSARCESQQSTSHQRYPELQLGAQLSDLESDSLIALKEEASEDMDSQLELPENDHPSSCSSFDVPTRALVNAVRSARDVRSLPDSVRSMDKDLRSDEEEAENTVHMDAFTDLQTPLAEAMSFSTLSFRSTISTKTVVPMTSDETDTAFDITFPEAPTKAEPKPVKSEEKKVYRDMSTSPINFDKTNETLNKTPKIKQKSVKIPANWSECSTAASCSSSNSSSSSSDTVCGSVEKSNSSDSLGEYSTPKLGEPGRPGTRDLEFSIRRLNLRKQIEQNYQKFRQQRGLIPAKFYSAPISNISTNSRSILDKEHMEEKLAAADLPTSNAVGNPLTTSSSQWLLNNCNSPLSSLRPWVTQGRLQQCWKRTPPPSKHPPVGSASNQGVMLRRVDKDNAQSVPRSGSCSRLDGILRQLVEEPPGQPQPLPQHQPIIMRPTLASLLLFKNQRSRRFPQLLPQSLDYTKAAISRGTSPVADFSFSKNVLGLNAMGGEPVLSTSPGCGHGTTILDDKYCRKCGVRILMVCSECEKSIRPDDKFCAHCGHRRWKLYELWRYGMLHKSPLFVLGTVALAGGAYLALYMFLNTSKRRILR